MLDTIVNCMYWGTSVGFLDWTSIYAPPVLKLLVHFHWRLKIAYWRLETIDMLDTIVHCIC